MKSVGEATKLNYSFNIFYEAPSYSVLTSGNISCGLLHRSNLSDELSSNASGGVEADSDSAIVFRYLDIRYVGDHCCNYRREGRNEGREEGEKRAKKGERKEGREEEFEGGEDGGMKEEREDEIEERPTRERETRVRRTDILCVCM